MKRLAIGAGALGVIVLAGCGSAGAVSTPATWVTSCTVLAGNARTAIAEVKIANETSKTLTLSGFTVEGFANGARVSDATTSFKHPNHVRAGRVRRIHVIVDERTQKCSVQLIA